MQMRRWVTYVMLIANYIIAIACAITLIIFLRNRDNSIPSYINKMHLAIIAPIVGLVMSTCLVVLYAFLLKKSLKEQVAHMNPKLLKLIQSSTYISIGNLFFPPLLLITACSIAAIQNSQTASLALIITAFALTGVIGLFITGYTSYVNFRISFNEEKRKTLLEGFEPTMKMYHDDTQYKDEATKEKYQPKEIVLDDVDGDDSLASSRSFGNGK